MTYQFKRQNQSGLGNASLSQEQDCYSTLIVEDLLQGASDWRDVKDIVRLTIRALTDVVKSHSETIREIERQLPAKAGKSELNAGLAQKANITEVSRTVAEVAAAVDSKICYDDLQLILKDFVSKNDLQYSLSSKVNIEEVRSLVQQRASSSDLKQETASLAERLEDLQKEFAKKSASQVQQRDIQDILAQLELKANIAEVNEALENKANKSSVSNALHRKANKVDLEEHYARKHELVHITTRLEGVDAKAEYSTIEKLTQVLHNKVDKSDFTQLREELRSLKQNEESPLVKKLQQDIQSMSSREHELVVQSEELSKLVQEITSRISAFDGSLEVINTKADIEVMEQLLGELRQEVQEALSKLQDDSVKGVAASSDKQFTFSESLKDELLRVKDEMEKFIEERVQSELGLGQFVKQQGELFERELVTQTEKIYVELEDVRRQLDDVTATKVDAKDFAEDKARTLAVLEDKVDLQEVQQALNVCQADISARLVEYKEEMKLSFKIVEQDILGLLSKKANIADLGEGGAFRKGIDTAAGRKTNSKELDALRLLVDKLTQETEQKLSLSEFANHLSQTKNALDAVSKDMVLKANIKDVCALMDQKANIDDMNKALNEIYKELDSKSSQDDLNTIVGDQAIINESLCTENIVGRWTWKSQNIKQGNLVPWESQVVNTLPDNFLWEKDRAYVMCVAPGLYQVSFGFFCGRRPNVSLLVNGEAAFSCEGASGNSPSQYVSYGNHSSGNIAGLTLSEFLVLPERARISIVFEGDYGAEGFLSLKRL